MGNVSRFLIIALLVVAMAGCASTLHKNQYNTLRGRGDAPVGQVDNTRKDVIQMPDRFANVADACDGHGHRIFVTTHVDAFGYFVVLPDPTC